MYWYRVNIRITAALIGSAILLCTACKPDIKETGTALKYFDLKGYFTADAARLTKLNKQVLKTVIHNGVTESKQVKIDNWGRELDLFIGSDINKPAWKNSYTITADSSAILYKAKDPELTVQKILINLDNKNKVKWIMILNHTKNILYQTYEKLSYFPDSLYLIEKLQRVRLMGTNTYRIKGVIER
jgi:hypothetical protein